ncbi:hypothetical protein EYF80_068101 [Liparis tanakae]|uniref:Uncharacterized protein n=1 Tax=Liparis tanakae TaxID=230148 RepID=A0A4Z2DZC5_9TELE|nr:hypothetical protein EYF80_068101 [Liparis tanakae]
MPVCHHIQL